MKGHTVFPAIVEDSHLLFSILTEDGIAASAEPVPGIKRLGQRLERADRLRGKAADEKTRLRVDDSATTSFAVIKHEPHLPFRYDSIIAGAVYNNMDSAVLSGICYAGDAEKPPVPAVFQGYGPSVIIGSQKTQIYLYQNMNGKSDVYHRDRESSHCLSIKSYYEKEIYQFRHIYH